MTTTEWGKLLEHHLRDQARTYPWLVDRIAEITGRKRPDPTTVTKWIKGEYGPPDPDVVFAVEEALGQAPGSMSQVLGYLPVAHDGDHPGGVVAALDRDPRLTVMGRRVVLKVYEEFVADSPDGSDR